jgi:hypothetical protein
MITAASSSLTKLSSSCSHFANSIDSIASFTVLGCLVVPHFVVDFLSHFVKEFVKA